MARDDMLFRIGVEDGDFRAGIERAKASLKGLTYEYKENERAAKQLGDAQGAQQAKVNGLKERLDILKKNYSFLKEQETQLGERTKSNAKTYDSLQKELGRTSAQLDKASAAFKGQEAVLKSMLTGNKQYTESLDKMQSSLKTSSELYKSQANNLKSSKNLTQSLVTSYNGVVDSIKKTNAIRDLEVKHLEELGNAYESNKRKMNDQQQIVAKEKLALQELNDAGNASANSIEKQAKAVDDAKLKLSGFKNATDKSNTSLNEQKLQVSKTTEKLYTFRDQLKTSQSQLNKFSPYGVSKVGDAFNKAARASNKLNDKMSNALSNIKQHAMSAAIGIGSIGAVSVKGAKLAGDLQDTYKRNYNLLITSGEKQAEVQKNINQMQADGKKLSVEYGVSQEKIAEGYQELIKRGYTSAEALGAMKTELQGSVASGDDFNNVLGVSSQVIDAFGLRTNNTAKMTKNTKDVVNQLAYAADMTATDFQSLGKGMEYVGDSAHSAGFQLSEASSAMGILSNHGLEADKAGTGLRKVINSISGALADQEAAQKGTASSMATLNGQISDHKNKITGYQEAVKNGTMSTKDAAKAIGKQQDAIDKLEGKIQGIKSGGTNDMLTKLGISRDQLVDSNGNLKSMTDIMEVINDKTKHMGTAQKNSVFNSLFGTTGQQAGIILAQNNEELGKLNDKVKKSADGQGYVADLAKRNMGTVKQELKQFKEAGNAALILIGKEMLPVIQDASIKMVKFLNSKEGQKGLKILAKGIASVMGGIKDGISFMVDHQKFVETVAVSFASLWAVGKIGKFLGLLKDVYGTVKAIAGVDMFTSIMGGKGGLGKLGKLGKGAGVATEVGELAGGAGKLGKVAGGVGKFAKIGGGALGIGTLISAGSELTHGSAGGRIGGATGTLGGAAAGAALGSIIPGLGTAIGALIGGGLGAFGGSKLGRGVGNSISKNGVGGTVKNAGKSIGNLFGGIGKSFRGLGKLGKGTALEGLATKIELQLDKKKATKEMKEFSKSYAKDMKALNKNNKIVVSNDMLATNRTKKQQQKLYDDLQGNIEKYYHKKSKTEDKDYKTLLKNGVITKKQYDKMLDQARKHDGKKESSQLNTLNKMRKNTDKYYDKVAKIQSGGTKKLQKIADKYGAGSKQYQKELHKELNKAQSNYAKKQQKIEKSMNDSVSKETKIAAGKQKDILTSLRENKKKISLDQAKETILNSKKERDGVISSAKETYKKSVSHANSKYRETVKAADKERYENGTMSKKQYDEVIKHAKKQRDDAISAADKQKKDTTKKAQETHKQVVNEATKQAKEHKGAIDGETGDMKNSWSNGVEKLRGIWNSMIGGINHVLNALHKGWGGIPKWGKGYATGTRGLLTDETALVGEEGFELAYNNRQGLFAVGANGPEIRKLKAGTSILPHKMSKEFLQMTNKLPAHKDGVSGAIHDAYDWTKNKVSDGAKWMSNKLDDIEDFISDGADKVYDTIMGKMGFKKDMFASGAFNSLANGEADKTRTDFIKHLKTMFDKHDAEDGGGQHGNPAGAGVQRWKGLVKKALKANGLSTSEGMIQKVLRQIQTESGGNPKAIQGNIGDINNKTGNLARGLMQVIPPTFNANKFPGHNDPFNGYDSLLAGLNYAKKRYGRNLSFLGNGHGYEHGGLISEHQIAELGENGKKEMVIPLDISERSRAIPLMKTAMNEMNKNSRNNQEQVSVGNSDIDLTEVLNKIDQVVGGLSMVVQAVQTSLTDKRVTDAVNRQTRRTNNLQSQMKGL